MKFSKGDIISYAAIIVIVVSMASIGMQFTGYDTISSKTAIVNVTIETSAAINFTIALVEFGEGSVTAEESGATLETGEAAVNGDWAGTISALSLENIGNVNITLNLSADVAAAAYLGGSSPLFQYKVTDADANSCGGVAGTYIDFATTPGALVCSPLDWNDTRDEINIDIKLFIPVDAAVGTKTATITASGTYIP